MFRRNSRGQANSVDLAVAILSFIIMLVFIFSLWFNSTSSATLMLAKNRMEFNLISISDVLIKSQGLPTNWESNLSNTSMLGLASSANVLSAAKLSNFTNLSYSQLKSLLGASDEFYFYVKDFSGNTLYQTGNATFSGQTSVSITRFAVLNNQKVKVEMILHD